jgi:hypothetical protein
MMQTTQNEQATKMGNWIAARLDKYEAFIFLILIFSLIVRTTTEISINILIVLTLMTMAVMYFFSGFANINFDYAGGLDIFFHKLASWGCSIGIIGILFRLQSWASYDLLIWIGCATMIIILPFIVYRKSKNEELKLFNSRYILRIVLICFVGFLLAYTPNDVLVKSKIITQPNIEKIK